jgi:hypothetical protein
LSRARARGMTRLPIAYFIDDAIKTLEALG